MTIRPAWIAASGLAVAVAAAAAWPLLTGVLAGHVRDRLARETGLDWRIGSVALGAGPSLVLSDVGAGRAGAGLGLDVRKVHLSGPFALVMGGAGALRVRVEEARLRLPLDGEPATPRAGGEGQPGLSALAGGARIEAFDLSADGRSLSVTVPAADLTLDLDSGPVPAGATYRLDLDAGGHRLALALDPPAGSGRPLRLTLEPGGPSGRRGTIAGSLRLEGRRVALDRLTGTLDGAALSGDLLCDLPAGASAKPRIAADLRLDALALAPEGSSTRAPAGLTVPVPVGILPDPRWFAAVEGEGRIALGRLVLGPARIEGVAVTAKVGAGVLEAGLAAARAYEGTLKVRYALAPAGTAGRHRLGLALTQGQVRPLLGDLLGIAAIDGRLTASLDIEAVAARPEDVPRAATGSADMSVTDGTLEGSELLAVLASLGQERGSAATRFSYLGGRLRIAQGTGVTEGLSLRSPLIEAGGSGSLDLVGQTLDLTFQPRVTPQRGRRPGRSLSVPVRVAGPWRDPAVSADMAGLLDDPAGAMEALQDLGTGLLGGPSATGGKSATGGGQGAIGGELGGFLDAILPRSRPDAPVPRRR
ncbi:AsmA-like C-terminal region-containing protein [Methylobacterium sp. Leaf466]|uniref:AsmA family protein n=1 Tax=Methylobacterium sp. Leaf466 TaxID=1736386 RepID=UPI0006F8B61C|nr:AsmA-like C-terminal region-containing protein [Methylobacterium sp. Leaf466]KQT83784.1 hypothetical protein ASG59_18010 [Methylobacterium sp. Leaf466]